MIPRAMFIGLGISDVVWVSTSMERACLEKVNTATTTARPPETPARFLQPSCVIPDTNRDVCASLSIRDPSYGMDEWPMHRGASRPHVSKAPLSGVAEQEKDGNLREKGGKRLTTGIANGVAIWVAPPQRALCNAAVDTWGAGGLKDRRGWEIEFVGAVCRQIRVRKRLPTTKKTYSGAYH